MNAIKERQEFENYNKIKLLGEGSFGKAFLVERASDKMKCVMKQIDIMKMSEQEKKETVQESKILEALSHPNIVKFIEVFKTKKGKLCIVMDFADGGDLSNRQKEQRGRFFTEAQVLEWFTQICLGLKHIHDRKILHRDLKGQNIFLTKQGIVKIGDFGIAKVLNTTMQNARTVVGTPYYLSPEIVQSRPYNFKSDIWSLGVVLYEMCALKPPFDAPSLHFLAMKIVRGAFNPLPQQYSQELKSLISSCLNTNEAKRPDINKILHLPIIQNRIKSFLTETVYKVEFSHTILHKQNVFDPKKDQIKQLQNLSNQIQLQKQLQPAPVQSRLPSNQISQQPQVPRYNPGVLRPQSNQPPSVAQNQQAARILNPQVNAAPKNVVSPGMAAAMGYNPQREKPKQPEPPKYGIQQPPSQPKPNYHYQQQQQQVKPQPTPEQVLAPDRKAIEERKAHEERMRLIDQKLKEKEAAIKQLDDEKRKRDEQRRQAERDLLEKKQREDAAVRRQKEEQEMQKRRIQDEQSKKIQDAQQKKKMEAEKFRKDQDKVRQQELNKKREKGWQDIEVPVTVEEKIQKQIKQQQPPPIQKQPSVAPQFVQQSQPDDETIRSIIKKANNKIFDIEKQIIGKNEQQPPVMKQPEEKKRSFGKEQPKSATRQDFYPAKLETKQQDLAKLREQEQQKLDENQAKIDKQKKEQERRRQIDELKQRGKQNKGKGFVEIVGMPDGMVQQDKSPKRSAAIPEKKREPIAHVAEPKQKKEEVKAKPHTSRPTAQDKSPQPVRKQVLETSRSPPRTKKVFKEEVKQEQPSTEYSEQMYLEQQQVIDQGDIEIYNMYEEMLNLVREDFRLETPQKDQDEEKKGSDEEDDFNDDRDDQWDKEKESEGCLEVKKDVSKGNGSANKQSIKKKYEPELSTVFEQTSDAENTLQGFKNRLGTPATKRDTEGNDSGDRDDFEDDETSTSTDNQAKQQPGNSDFTFIKQGEQNLFNDFSKLETIEEIRMNLESELGEDACLKAYPILKDFGDNIFLQEKIEELVKLLDGVLTPAQVNKYTTHFASLIFMELQAEENGGGQLGIDVAMKTFKNINTTACFGRY